MEAQSQTNPYLLLLRFDHQQIKQTVVFFCGSYTEKAEYAQQHPDPKQRATEQRNPQEAVQTYPNQTNPDSITGILGGYSVWVQ